MVFVPYESPWASVLGRELGLVVCRAVVLFDTPVQVLGLPHVELAVWVLDNVDEERQPPRVGFEPTT